MLNVLPNVLLNVMLNVGSREKILHVDLHVVPSCIELKMEGSSSCSA